MKISLERLVDNAANGMISYSLMTQTITAIRKNIINLLYPLHCATCKIPLEPLNKTGVCSFCESQIKKNPEPYCTLCGRSMRSSGELCAECKRTCLSFDRSWSACLYEGTMKELIHLFKYRGKLLLSGILCDKIIDFVKKNEQIIDGIDYVTFVPLYNGWLNEREYNHSGILAAAISTEFRIPVSKALEKRSKTRRQSELSRDERLINLAGVFKTKDDARLNGSKLLLIDDVMTTGTTLSECAKTFKAAGAKEVRCLTLARGIQ